MPAHRPGEFIEGLKIEGHSRDPLIYQKTIIIYEVKYYSFKAYFNVFSKIVIVLTGTQKIEENALIMKGETLSCDTAQIKTIASAHNPNKNKLIQKLTPHVTHTH
jgi:hypothetical protein